MGTNGAFGGPLRGFWRISSSNDMVRRVRHSPCLLLSPLLTVRRFSRIICPKPSKVLRRIADSRILLKGPDAYADVGERSGKEALLRLENLRLIHRPKGPKSGYTATDAGRNRLS